MSKDDKKQPAGPATDFGAPWLPGDRLPSIQAEERSSDSAWALFNALSTGQQEPFPDTAAASLPMKLEAASAAAPPYADTEPAGLPVRRSAPPLSPAARVTPSVNLDQVLLEARKNNRVCPRPAHWQVFYELLLRGREDRAGLTPPIPIAAWKSTPSLSKRMCLREQLEWAAANGRLAEAYAFIRQLPEDQWHRMGD